MCFYTDISLLITIYSQSNNIKKMKNKYLYRERNQLLKKNNEHN